jgi:hypothetical protein
MFWARAGGFIVVTPPVPPRNFDWAAHTRVERDFVPEAVRFRSGVVHLHYRHVNRAGAQ